MEKDFFVGIYDPVDVRRNLLEGSREIIKSLQSYQKLEELREMKLKMYGKMKNVMDELDFLVNKLNQELPRTHLRKKVDARMPAEPKKMNLASELDKLEKQLELVERELSALK